MADFYISFSGGNQVGLIVRGKTSHSHEPGVMEQHADCIISNGSPFGFFGEGDGASGKGGSIGIGMDGVVYDMTEFKKKRPFYVDSAIAKGYGVVSTALLISVSSSQAKKFDDYWRALQKDPGSFHILGWNCSTHASAAFEAAGILSGGIPGLDTPNNLYLQLCTEKKGKVSAASGYVGFASRGSGYDLIINK